MKQGTSAGATSQRGEIGYVSVRPHGLDCCTGVAMAKAQHGVGFTHRLDVRILFKAFSYCGEATGPRELGCGVIVFREIVLSKARLNVGVSVELEFWDEALGACEVDDEVQLGGIFGVRVRNRGWVVAYESVTVR